MSIEPVNNRPEPTGADPPDGNENLLRRTATRTAEAVSRLGARLSQDAAAMLHRSARRLELVSGDPRRMTRLIASTRSIQDPRTRAAAIEALGFDRDTAEGLNLRVANLWPVFRNGQAAMHKRSPLSVQEAGQTIQIQAHKLRELAERVSGQTTGQPPPARQGQTSIRDAGQTSAAISWDVVTAAKATPVGLAPAGSLVLAAASEIAADADWETAKLLATTEAMSLDDLEQARAEYYRRMGANRASVILSPIPFSSTIVAGLSNLESHLATRSARGPSPYSLIQKACSSP